MVKIEVFYCYYPWIYSSCYFYLLFISCLLVYNYID